MKPLCRAKSKNARSFSSSHGRYGVKNTSALDEGLRRSVRLMVDISLACSEWLNTRSAKINNSNPMGKVEGIGAPQR